MRPVLHGDLVTAACALLAVPPGARGPLVRRMLAEAQAADAHRLLTGRAHPDWGGGSLMAAALTHPRRPEPGLEDPEYAGCLIAVLAALRARRAAAGGA